MPSAFRSARSTVLAALIIGSSGFLLTAARTPAPGDACSLLTKEAAAAALGEAVTGPKAVGARPAGAGGTVSSCEYTGSGLHRINLILTQLAPSNVAMYKGIICNKKTNDGLAGLGDLACWYNEKHAELHVIKGTAFLSVQMARSGNPSESMIALMKKALARLK